jgi:hypothetical protein
MIKTKPRNIETSEWEQSRSSIVTGGELDLNKAWNRSKRTLMMGILCVFTATTIAAETIDFGDNSGEYSKDGECDDRRFTGLGMSSSLDFKSIGRDSSDCRAAFEDGSIKLWNKDAALAATQCPKINFGNDGSEYAHDGACDDPRFEGFGMAEVVNRGDKRSDASDCRRLCEFGLIGIRDY